MTDLNGFMQSFAENRNITAGICDAAPLGETRLNTSTPFVSTDIEKRTNPAAAMPGVKSIIAIGVPQNIPPSHAPANPEKATAQLSSMGATIDYHNCVKSVLRELADELKNNLTFKHKILADSPALDERAYAHKAGIGFFGRNGLLISPKFGTRFNIGLLLTSIPMSVFSPPSPAAPAACPPNCRLCIANCPGNALQENAPLNIASCISYLTQKDNLTPAEENLLGQSRQLYGCDICQNICPFNAPIPPICIDPAEWLTLTDAEFRQQYAHTAILWRGTEILRRNARIILET